MTRPEFTLPQIVRRAAHAPRSSKRGLIAIPSTASTTITDLDTFTASGSDLTWYYNYGVQPTTDPLSSTSLQFVPMLWSATDSDPGTSFAADVGILINSGMNITSILTFNEPDACSGGGSCTSASLAASAWTQSLNPLREKYGVKLGAPAVTGSPGGLQWLNDWLDACNGNCNPDFVAVHWYGNFAGLASWIGQVNATFVNSTKTKPVKDGMWVTEFAYPNGDLQDTQSFYNTSTQYFDRLDYIMRYSYFGSFRSTVSNIGPDVAMLDGNGQLTDIGSWYLGGAATGVIPNSGASTVLQPTSIITISLLMLILSFFQ